MKTKKNDIEVKIKEQHKMQNPKNVHINIFT